ncbi:cytidylyltransferase domain-containing protein [Anoxybacteroides rupiense]|uniref:cytidylyltransferase domain-containing protein n=1 Tax=Anoxybacteroides rupiense TaxID=311460 RepID=UPI00160570A3|nr:glycosyltransferase family protein [Anoxybacillus rupiensis]MBB3908600.1 spore coat polysaccharide biosynthesis protein SpsF [Anoxybacillus rupiensis]
MKTLIIIQARMGSSRLPGKVLMPLGDSVVLDYVVSRCKQVQPVVDVIVATSVLPQDDAIEAWCKEHGVSCFRGSEDDVLARYYECARSYQPNYVIRVTADCPFVDYELANQIVERMNMDPSDIVIVDGDLPRGLVIEMISFSALKYIYHHGKEPRHREHVTYYAYEFPDEFHHTYVQAPREIQQPQLRITLDTEEDYQLCKAIADYFKGDNLISARQVVKFLLENPAISKLNAHIQQKPVV